MISDDEIDGVVMMLCDQPFVTAGVLNRLVTTHHETRTPIVASTYGTTTGVPAFFSRKLFPALMSLSADEGARRIIISHPQDVSTVTFPEGMVDVDTPADHQQLRQDLQN